MWKATNYADLTVCCLPQGFLARNITDVCFTSTPGVDDLLCQAIEENTFIDLIESTTFPVSICHSPNDDLVPIGHAPDVSINPLLSKLTLLGQGPTAGHFESSFLCQMAFILQFTAFGSAPAPLSGIEPLTDPSTCTATVSPVSDVAPATLAPVIMVAPATLAPLTLAPLLTLASGQSAVPKSNKKGNGGKKEKKDRKSEWRKRGF